MSMPRRAMEQMGFSICCPDLRRPRCDRILPMQVMHRGAHESKGQDVRSGNLEGRQAVQGASDDAGIPC